MRIGCADGYTVKKRSGKKKIIIIAVIILAVFMIFIMLPDGDEDSTGQSAGQSEEQTSQMQDLEGSASERKSGVNNTVVMVYMIGSDLESEDGAATDDLDEMKAADYGDKLKVVVETGGASQWQTDGISADKDQRWLINDDGLQYIDDTGYNCMADKQNLTDFISDTAKDYPADRYMLIFWDHGGGTVGGFGCDELNDDAGLSIADVSEAVAKAGVRFDIIGFDACMMGTIETAYALEPSADYMVASENTEPGEGWYYTNCLSMLGKDPAVGSKEVGPRIIKDFDDSYTAEDEATLSMIDLGKIPDVYEKMGEFLNNAEQSIKADNNGFHEMSQARSRALTFADREYDQVDIIDLADRTDFNGKDAMISALKSCVVCRNASPLKGANGLAMYFPYTDIEGYGDTQVILNDIGYKTPQEFYSYFLSIMAGGQQRNEDDSGGIINEQTPDYSGEDWYEDDQSDFDYGSDYGELALDETDDGYELKLPDDVWDTITDIQLAVMIKYEDGYLDLGEDNVGSINDDGALAVDFDGTWISIGGEPVEFHANKTYETEKGTIFSGTVNALLNDSVPIELQLEWEPMDENRADDPDYQQKGFIRGYREVEEDTQTQAKGLKELKAGDSLKFQYDYYDEDGNYKDTITPEDAVTVGTDGNPEVSYAQISASEVDYWAILYDIFQQQLNTETIAYTE